MNWTCNCSLYNTIVLVVYIILLSERGSEAAFCESRVVVKFRAFHAAGDSWSRVGRGAFGGIISLSSLTRNANAGIRGNKHGHMYVLVEFEL